MTLRWRVFLLSLTALACLAQNANLQFNIAANPSIGISVPASIPWTITGGTPPYTVSLQDPNSLPPGLLLDPDNNGITGTPTKLGSYPVALTVVDAARNLASAVIVITVAPPVAITTTTLPAAVSGQPYAQQLAAAGGATPYVWSIAGGTLPPGFRMDTKGIVGGVPSGSGSTYSFSVTVTDAQGKTATQMLSVQVLPPPPVFTADRVVNAASFTGAISPGAYASIYGSNLAPSTASAPAPPFADALAGVTVMVNGVRAALLYVSPTQINFQVPAATQPGKATLVVTSQGSVSGSVAVDVLAADPGIFQAAGRALAVNQDGSLNGPARPARAGTVVALFATGLGQFRGDQPNGGIWPSNTLINTTLPVTAVIGGPADVVFAGAAPGEGNGMAQINVRIPAGLPSGDYMVQISTGERASNTVLVTVAAGS